MIEMDEIKKRNGTAYAKMEEKRGKSSRIVYLPIQIYIPNGLITVELKLLRLPLVISNRNRPFVIRNRLVKEKIK